MKTQYISQTYTGKTCKIQFLFLIYVSSVFLHVCIGIQDHVAGCQIRNYIQLVIYSSKVMIHMAVYKYVYYYY